MIEKRGLIVGIYSMSNQRPGKMHRAAMSDNDPRGMVLRGFFRNAAKLLKENGNDDAAFYFEQCEDWVNDGKQIQNGEKDVARILGL